MPKAVLIIDMPKNCGECPLNYDTLECIAGDAEGKLINTDYANRPERCQLKPLVEAIPIEWIKKWSKKNYYDEQGLPLFQELCRLTTIVYMIEDWRKENK